MTTADVIWDWIGRPPLGSLYSNLRSKVNQRIVSTDTHYLLRSALGSIIKGAFGAVLLRHTTKCYSERMLWESSDVRKRCPFTARSSLGRPFEFRAQKFAAGTDGKRQSRRAACVKHKNLEAISSDRRVWQNPPFLLSSNYMKDACMNVRL
ncbi:hypothetical protein BJV77DRAFT_599478 [Russula vinacea]|nr:hypothetical protein BJV77DRAFT_599478 [Russula vinacea]